MLSTSLLPFLLTYSLIPFASTLALQKPVVSDEPYSFLKSYSRPYCVFRPAQPAIPPTPNSRLNTLPPTSWSILADLIGAHLSSLRDSSLNKTQVISVQLLAPSSPDSSTTEMPRSPPPAILLPVEITLYYHSFVSADVVSDKYSPSTSGLQPAGENLPLGGNDFRCQDHAVGCMRQRAGVAELRKGKAVLEKLEWKIELAGWAKTNEEIDSARAKELDWEREDPWD
ncbi:hypothetical protein MMC20_000451 [Loxospora ochrophaea]|nr:hypothetical protein [Loxospora ochrophaea]